VRAASGKALQRGKIRRQVRGRVRPSPGKANDRENQDQNAYGFVQAIERTHFEIGDQQPGGNLKEHQDGREPVKQSSGQSVAAAFLEYVTHGGKP